MRTRTGQAPHVLATPNNLALGLLGRLEITEIAQAQHSIAYPDWITLGDDQRQAGKDFPSGECHDKGVEP